MLDLIARPLVSGTAASLATSAALALRTRTEGRGAVQPLNAAAHWYLGERVGRSRAVDVRHRLGGLAIHHAASLFRAIGFEALRRLRPDRVRSATRSPWRRGSTNSTGRGARAFPGRRA